MPREEKVAKSQILFILKVEHKGTRIMCREVSSYEMSRITKFSKVEGINCCDSNESRKAPLHDLELKEWFLVNHSHCVKSVRIWSYSGRHFSRICPHWTEYGEYLSVFSPNAEKCGKNADQNNFEYGHLLRTVSFTFWQFFGLDWKLQVEKHPTVILKLSPDEMEKLTVLSLIVINGTLLGTYLGPC